MRQRSFTHVVATITLAAIATACGSSDAGTGSAAEDIATPAPPASAAPSANDADIDDADDDAATDTTTATDTATATTPDAASGNTETETGSDTGGDSDEAVGAEAPAPGVLDVSLTDEERSAADDPVAQAIVAAFPAGFTPPTDEQAACLGGKIVNELGPDRLAELGITADSVDVFGASDFTAGEVDAMVDILFECIDVQNLVASMFAPSAGPETAECYADFVHEDLIRDLAAPFLGGGAIDAELFLEQVQAANAACLPADS